MSALKVNKTVQHDTNLALGRFKDYHSNLAGKRLKKLPKPSNKFTLNTVFQHYKGITQSDSFNLATGCFLKDGAEVLTKPVTDLYQSPLKNFLTPVKKQS